MSEREKPLWDPRDLTADEPPIIAFHNLLFEGDGKSLWISASDGGPLYAKRCSVTYSKFMGITTPARTTLAFGTREDLEASDAYVKVLVDEVPAKD